jgi:hypothetical protein
VWKHVDYENDDDGTGRADQHRHTGHTPSAG